MTGLALVCAALAGFVLGWASRGQCHRKRPTIEPARAPGRLPRIVARFRRRKAERRECIPVEVTE